MKMSTEYFYETSDTVITKKKSVEKGLKRLLIIAVIILTAELIWLFGVSPFIPLYSVEVRGIL